jgi:hypothetical protein
MSEGCGDAREEASRLGFFTNRKSVEEYCRKGRPPYLRSGNVAQLNLDRQHLAFGHYHHLACMPLARLHGGSMGCAAHD